MNMFGRVEKTESVVSSKLKMTAGVLVNNRGKKDKRTYIHSLHHFKFAVCEQSSIKQYY